MRSQQLAKKIRQLSLPILFILFIFLLFTGIFYLTVCKYHGVVSDGLATILNETGLSRVSQCLDKKLYVFTGKVLRMVE